MLYLILLYMLLILFESRSRCDQGSDLEQQFRGMKWLIDFIAEKIQFVSFD